MKFARRPTHALLLSGMLFCSLNACGKTTGSVAPETRVAPPAPSACLVFGPIYWSVADTDESIRQMKAHNAAGKILCAWGTKAPVSGSTPAGVATPPEANPAPPH